VTMGKFELTGDDAMAQAAVVGRVIKQILAGWPRTAYAGEIRRLVRATLCEGTLARRARMARKYEPQRGVDRLSQGGHAESGERRCQVRRKTVIAA
jgi:hypothetical protein